MKNNISNNSLLYNYSKLNDFSEKFENKNLTKEFKSKGALWNNFNWFRFICNNIKKKINFYSFNISFWIYFYNNIIFFNL